MAYGYIAAAPGTPDYRAQHYGILSHATSYGLGPVHICHEAATEHIHGGKPVLSGMIDNLQREDVLLVANFNSLGSSTVEVLGILSTLSQRGVSLYVVNSGFKLDSNADALVVATACSLIQIIEKELQVRSEPAQVPIQMQRDDADLQTPVRRTRKSKLDGREEEIRSMLTEGASLNLIASTLGLTSRQSLSDFIHSRNLSVQNPPTTT